MSGIAQEEDLELWSSIKFSKKVNKKIKFQLEEQIRWSDSISRYKKSFTDLSFEYKLLKRHSLSLNSRLTENLDKEKYGRVALSLNSYLRLFKDILTLKQRIRLQRSWDDQNQLDKFYFRIKYGIQRKYSFISPYLDQEYFWDAQNQMLMSKQRTTIGVSISFSKGFRMKLFTRKQRELNRNNPDYLTIIGIATHYKF